MQRIPQTSGLSPLRCNNYQLRFIDLNQSLLNIYANNKNSLFIAMKLKYVFAFVLLISSSALFAQQLQRSYTIPVTQGETELYNAWAGGLNSCQVSTFDANLDGMQDIFIFDRLGARISIFINMDDSPGVMNYKYTLEYNDAFPSNLRNWTFLRDMNCDGKKDICSNTGSGFKIFWNISDTELEFSETSSGTMQANYDFGGEPYDAGIYSIAPDLPAIDDYDGDGDMDMWTWNDYGTSVFFYKNYAVENGDCTTPEFKCKSRCYGLFGEYTDSFTLELDTDFDCLFNVIDPRSESSTILRHTGGTILTLDLDNNGMKDLVISDVTESNDAALKIVEASNDVDSVASADYDFPATYNSTQAVDLDLFPGNFYEDVNNDGVKDLIVSPNAYSDAEDRFGMLLYLNTGSNSLPIFEFETYTFLQDEMIELGTSCFPVAFDVDNDGLNDLLLSNRKYYDALGGMTSRITYYHNTGDALNPEFTLENENWMDMASLGFEVVYPSFGDLDDDGDDDMILGEQNGYLHFFRNTAAIGEPCVFEIEESPIVDANSTDLDVGQNSTPQLVDINEDGKLDLILGELNGSVNYYQNIGTAEEYDYQLIEDTIGDVVATSVLGIQGKSVPYMFKDNNNLWQLLIGTETGQINHYNTIEGNFLGAFSLVTSDFEGIDEGERASVSMTDLNADDVLDLLVGNIGGGMGIYISPGTAVEEVLSSNDILLYPNPAQNTITLHSQKQSIQSCAIYDASGRLVENMPVNAIRTVIDISAFPRGVYHVSVLVGRSVVNKKLVVVR